MAAIKWRDSVEMTKDWSNYILMALCDWLWRDNKAIRGKEYIK